MNKITIIKEDDLDKDNISKVLRASIKKLRKRWPALFPLAIMGDISRPLGIFPNLNGLCFFEKDNLKSINKKKLKVYTTEWCGDCKVLYKYFLQRNVNYETFDIDFDEESLKEVLLVSLGRRVIPTLDYGDFVLINPPISVLEHAYRKKELS